MNNIAFIDGQNLHMGTTRSVNNPWRVDLKRLRIYLKNKYQVETAYYFLGFSDDAQQRLYSDIINAGFILRFREHSSQMLGKKKGNVDSDIIFHIMKKLYLKEEFNKIVLVSGDGDYKLLIDFLIENSKFEKILFPENKRASSLYKQLSAKYFASLDNPDTKKKIEMKKGP